MIISDFIVAFSKAWKEINKDKIRSKIQIKEIKALMNEWKERTDDIKKVEDLLSKHWKYLPITQRRDYVQKTYDLIHYGFDIGYSEDGTRTYMGAYEYGLTKIYDYIYGVCLNNYIDMLSYYHQKNYDMVDKKYKSCLDCVNEKLEAYNIVSKTNDSK